MSNTFNSPECTCGHDHDGLDTILMRTLEFNEEFAKATGTNYVSEQVAADVEWAAQHVGWRKDPEQAERTYNVPDCTCGQDHDGLNHIVRALLIMAAIKPEVTIADLGREFEQAAVKVGWVKA